MDTDNITHQTLITTQLPEKPLIFEFSDEKNKGTVQSMESSQIMLLPNRTFTFKQKRGSWDVTKISGWEMKLQEGLYVTYMGSYTMDTMTASGELTLVEGEAEEGKTQG